MLYTLQKNFFLSIFLTDNKLLHLAPRGCFKGLLSSAPRPPSKPGHLYSPRLHTFVRCSPAGSLLHSYSRKSPLLRFLLSFSSGLVCLLSGAAFLTALPAKFPLLDSRRFCLNWPILSPCLPGLSLHIRNHILLLGISFPLKSFHIHIFGICIPSVRSSLLQNSLSRILI